MSLGGEPQNPKGHVPDEQEIVDDVAREGPPTIDKPLHGPRRGPWVPLLVTLAVFAVLAVLYFWGMGDLVGQN